MSQHGAGFDIRSEEKLQRVLADFDRTVGFGFLLGLHLNDSKALLGSQRDRHENIGHGTIGAEVF
jgi:endonuclease IV